MTTLCFVPAECGLSSVEFGILRETCGLFLFKAGFLQTLRRALVTLLQVKQPGLAEKLDLMSSGDFEALCERLQKKPRRGAPATQEG